MEKNHLDGYGEMNWVDGNKYYGFYKNDKKHGFGMYYSSDNKYFIGFWKNGKQDGFGKYIQNDKIRYSFWKNGKIDKKYENIDENEFFKNLENNKINFIYFKWDVKQLSSYFKNQTKYLNIIIHKNNITTGN